MRRSANMLVDLTGCSLTLLPGSNRGGIHSAGEAVSWDRAQSLLVDHGAADDRA